MLTFAARKGAYDKTPFFLYYRKKKLVKIINREAKESILLLQDNFKKYF